MRIHPTVEGLQLDRTRIARLLVDRVCVCARVCASAPHLRTDAWLLAVSRERGDVALLRMPGNEILNTLSSRRSAHPPSVLVSPPCATSRRTIRPSRSFRRGKNVAVNHRLDEVTILPSHRASLLTRDSSDSQNAVDAWKP